ncbi:MAG: T9SS type A sorting domain-containing protein [Ignavibacteria bacterium]|nr:T9SS type A sorting domain-containing protein [Ignavibacteria bacterium]MCU7505179.1 T9SS type A sorting domain-containing protein [Ignavibacteria bacterium]MCU7518386.1 T9SS type A sorting domain-containing protein [Ignavibacteria bacterium]
MPDRIKDQENRDLVPELLVNKHANNSTSTFRPIIITIDSSKRRIYAYDKKGHRTTETVAEPENGTWVNSQRKTSYYDNNGNLVAVYTATNSNGIWTDVRKDLLTYNNNDKLISKHSECLRQGKWEQYERYTYTYDENGFQNGYILELCQNGIWGNNLRRSYTLDNRGDTLTFLSEDWANGAWKNNERYTYTYDGNGNLLTIQSDDWKDGAWESIMRITYTYDDNGKVLTHLYEEWWHDAWFKTTRDIYAYESNGRLLSNLSQRGDFNGGWQNYTRVTSSVSDDGKKVTNLNEKWVNDAWTQSDRDIVILDDKGKILSKSTENWTDSTWVNRNRVDYAHDVFGNTTGAVSIGLGESGSRAGYKDLLEFYYNNANDYLKIFCSAMEVEYESSAGDNPSIINAFTLSQNYPNPFNSSTTINYSVKRDGMVRIFAYNSLGSRVAVILDSYKPAGEYSVRFDGNGLPSGVYFYTLESGGITMARKLILLK